MDPFITIVIGNQKKNTKECNGGGKTPYWKEILEFSR